MRTEGKNEGWQDYLPVPAVTIPFDSIPYCSNGRKSAQMDGDGLF
jgi:hypothetical protein